MSYQQNALSNYNNSSKWQKHFIFQKLPLLLNHFLPYSADSSEVLTIADYGCSEGKNSILLFNEVINQFRKLTPKPISLFHIDLPSNNWQEVNKLLLSESSYLSHANVFPFTIGRSFYNQVLPDNSVHFAFSSFSFHYLSEKPVRKSGEQGIYHSALIEKGLADIESILRTRAKELVIGGKIFFIVVGRKPESNLLFLDVYSKTFMQLLQEGLVTMEELLTGEPINYDMTLDDWGKVLDNLKEIYEVECIEMERSVNPFYSAYLEERNLENFKNDIAAFCLVLMKSFIQGNIIRSTEEEYNRLFEALQRILMNVFDKEPLEYYLDITTVILKRIR